MICRTFYPQHFAWAELRCLRGDCPLSRADELDYALRQAQLLLL